MGRVKRFAMLDTMSRDHSMAASRWTAWILALLMGASAACGDAALAPDADAEKPASTAIPGSDRVGREPLQSFDPEFKLDEVWTGDLDGMVERGVVRAPVEFDRFLDQRLGRGPVKVSVLIITVARDEIIPALERRFGDLAAANLTITRSRLETVDFSDPFVTGVAELEVTGPAADPTRSLTRNQGWTSRCAARPARSG